MGAKRKPVSILQRERAQAHAQGTGKKKQKRATPQNGDAAQQGGGGSGGGESRRHQQRQGGAARQPQGPRPTSAVHAQAAHAVRRLLEADERKRGGASLKSLTLAPHVAAKKATYAVTVETLKHLPVLQPLLDRTALAEAGGGLGRALALVLAYEALLGEGLRATGPAERAVLERKGDLERGLRQLLAEAGAASAAELLPRPGPATPHPRTARVNTLRMGVAEALRWLAAPPPEHSTWAAVGRKARQDELLPDLLCFPPGTDLHDHPLVASGALLLQSKASCMPAHALAPRPGWAVVDACAAPGNKTTQLAALMRNRGSVVAFEARRAVPWRRPAPALTPPRRPPPWARRPGSAPRRALAAPVQKDPRRLERLRANAAAAGATIVQPRLADFLTVDPDEAQYADVRAVLLDPSCSGSGTAFTRMDWLLPSSADRLKGRAAVDHVDERVEALARFQTACLLHALRFPALERLVYSTCSVHARENEGVVAAVLGEAAAHGFSLEAALPAWPRRGVAGLVEGAERLLRVDPDEDGTDGFFVAVFARQAETAAKRRKQDGG